MLREITLAVALSLATTAVLAQGAPGPGSAPTTPQSTTPGAPQTPNHTAGAMPGSANPQLPTATAPGTPGSPGGHLGTGNPDQRPTGGTSNTGAPTSGTNR